MEKIKEIFAGMKSTTKNMYDELKEMKQKNKKGFVALILMILVLFLVFLGIFGQKGMPQTSRVSMVGVGDGECVFIQSGKYVYLYNAGTDKKHKTAIEDYMRYKDIDHIDGIILSNNKSRNLNRAKKIIKKFKIKEVYMSSFGDNNEDYLALIDYLDANKKSIDVKYPVMGDKIELSFGDIIFIQSNNEYKTMEDASLCIEYKDTRKLYAYMLGDIGPSAEKDIINNYVKKEKKNAQFTRIVVASNQGRKSTTSAQFLKAVKAELVLVSCSIDDEDLPSKELEKAADKVEADIYSTKDANVEVDSVKDAGVTTSTNMTEIEYSNTQRKINAFISREDEIKKHKYVGNRNTYLFYDNDDPIISTISDSNLTYFETKAIAQAAGFTYMPSSETPEAVSDDAY